MADGVTIGQAAAYAGVTVKAVRHYHRMGVLPEPERDFSGYRRYTSTDLLRLIQVRTLAEAGVPIAEIGTLLDSGEDGFDTAVAEVEATLTARIAELRRRRERLRRLRTGDRALLPERAAVALDTMTDLGFEADCVAAHREAMVLARALTPDQFDSYLGQLEHRLADPEHVALFKQSWEAVSWEPDDPRLEPLAAAMARNMLAHAGHLELPDLAAVPDRDARVEMINHHRGEQLPTSVVLTQLIEAYLRRAGYPVP